ncbi:MAG TPA: ester cyclase [Anaerolineales bacterium]|nr:ester cyclase [Anaerolineales bacterium]
MSVQDNLKIDEEEIAAWNAHDVERSLAIFPDDVIWHDVSSPQAMGKDGIRQYLQGWFSAFPDLKITVKNRVITEDYVAAELEFAGTNSGALQLAPGVPAIPATGRKVNGKGTYFVHFKNGKPVEVRSYPDAAGMMMQLGLMPMPGS